MPHKLLAEKMNDVSKDLVPTNLKDLFVPTAKIRSYNKRASVSRGCLRDNGATFIPGRDEKLHRVYIKPCLLRCESYIVPYKTRPNENLAPAQEPG